MKVMLHVQNTYGTGHLRMALNLATALDDVAIAYGGPSVPFQMPPNVTFHQLPVLEDDSGKLKTDNYSLDYVKRSRIQMLLSIYKHFMPDVLITEHFPFGRANFRFELIPLLDFAHGKCKIFSSFRGITGESATPSQITKDLEYFDGVFCHVDEGICKPDFDYDYIYTGFVAPVIPRKPMDGSIIVNVASGRGVDKILKLIKQEAYGGANFRPDIYDELSRASVIISTAGYNSAVETILTDAKTVLIPVNREQEQRAQEFDDAGLAISIRLEDLDAKKLARAMARESNKPKINTNGSQYVKEYLSDIPLGIDENVSAEEIKNAHRIRFCAKTDSQEFYQENAKLFHEIMNETTAKIVPSRVSALLQDIQKPVRLKNLNRSQNAKLNMLEFQQDKLVVGTYPTHLFMELTRNCNLLCKMCTRSSAPEFQGYHEKHNMDFGFFKKIADALFQKAVQVDLRGFGESTIMPEFEKYLDYALRFDPQFMLVTNMTLRNDHIWEKMIKNNFILGISIDGVDGTYESIRRNARFEDVGHNIKFVSQMIGKYRMSRDNLFFLTCVLKENFFELDKLIVFASKNKIPEVELIPVMNDEQNISAIPKSIARHNLRKIFSIAKKLGVRLNISGSLGFPDIENKELQGHCIRPWSYAYITYDGKLGPCNHRFNPPLVFADLNKQDFESAWNSVGFQVFRKTIHTKARFEKCNWCYSGRYI